MTVATRSTVAVYPIRSSMRQFVQYLRDMRQLVFEVCSDGSGVSIGHYEDIRFAM